ncbi:MAG: glycosyltransferase family 2 protein [Pseudomonadales bacterium]|nr:glycosyltransferase family 2 protein [Candidatus Woesebacteria bacterium]MCB9800863.1 glycosyltransferase family 2 protein [Pseudomonadales bacterium]
MKPYLSVVIPSYNEMSNLKRGVLEQVLEYLQKQDYRWELILTDDGSTDGTTKKLKEFAQKDKRISVVENIHAGKAPTVMSGMLAAKGEWRLFTDFDQSTPLSEIEKLLEFTKKGYNVIIGSREMVGARRDEEPWYRRVMGRGFNLIVQIFAVPGILDTQCGFKLFSAEATELLFNNLYIYGSQKERKDAYTGAFDVELLYLANKLGFKIQEVPITWYHNKTERVSPVKDSLRMFIDILRMRFARFRGKYDL